MSEDRPVKMCVCFDVTFQKLWDSGIRTAAEATEKFGCGTKCGSCLPYLRLMEKTGETEFEVLRIKY